MFIVNRLFILVLVSKSVITWFIVSKMLNMENLSVLRPKFPINYYAAFSDNFMLMLSKNMYISIIFHFEFLILWKTQQQNLEIKKFAKNIKTLSADASTKREIFDLHIHQNFVKSWKGKCSYTHTWHVPLTLEHVWI